MAICTAQVILAFIFLTTRQTLSIVILLYLDLSEIPLILLLLPLLGLL